MSYTCETVSGESIIGSVFGMAMTVVTPPAAAAAVALAQSSLCSSPGERAWM